MFWTESFSSIHQVKIILVRYYFFFVPKENIRFNLLYRRKISWKFYNSQHELLTLKYNLINTVENDEVAYANAWESHVSDARRFVAQHAAAPLTHSARSARPSWMHASNAVTLQATCHTRTIFKVIPCVWLLTTNTYHFDNWMTGKPVFLSVIWMIKRLPTIFLGHKNVTLFAILVFNTFDMN